MYGLREGGSPQKQPVQVVGDTEPGTAGVQGLFVTATNVHDVSLPSPHCSVTAHSSGSWSPLRFQAQGKIRAQKAGLPMYSTLLDIKLSHHHPLPIYRAPRNGPQQRK